MFNRFEDFETTAFVSFALMFHFLERRSPARKIDKKEAIRLDLIALGVLSGSLIAYRSGMGRFFDAYAGLFFASLPEKLSELVMALQTAPSYAKIAIYFVMTDFVLYWIHRTMHSFDLFWPTHVWHHTTEQLYWLSGVRTSLVHGFLYTLPQVFFPFYLLKFQLPEAAFAFMFAVLIQFWEHANLDLDLGPINWLIVGPVFHRVHHAVDRKYHDSNYGTLFTIWDRLFGTYLDPKTVPVGFPLGTPERAGMNTKTLRMVIGV